MAIMIHALLRYPVQDIFVHYSSNRTKSSWPNTALSFSEAGFKKFVLSSEVLLLKPYFIRNFMAPYSIYSLKKVVKTEIKLENLILYLFIVNFSKRRSG